MSRRDTFIPTLSRSRDVLSVIVTRQRLSRSCGLQSSPSLSEPSGQPWSLLHQPVKTRGHRLPSQKARLKLDEDSFTVDLLFGGWEVLIGDNLFRTARTNDHCNFKQKKSFLVETTIFVLSDGHLWSER